MVEANTSLLKLPQKQFDLLGHILVVALAFAIPISTTLTEICFYGAAICCVLAGNWQEKLRLLFFNPVILSMLALFLLFIIGCFYSTASLADSLGIIKKYDKLLIAVFLLPFFNATKWRDYAIFAFIAAMIITLIISYSAYFGLFSYKLKISPDSIFKDYLEQNLLMVFAVYLMGLLAMSHKKLRWIILILAMLAIYNIFFMNAGRSGYIIFVVLYMLFMWQYFRWRGVFIGAVCLAVFLGSVFGYSKIFKERVSLVKTDMTQLQHGQADTSVGQRFTYAKTSLKLVKLHPWFGTGTGSFSKEYLKLNTNSVLSSTNPHNEYLNITIQLGMPGLFLFILLLGVAWRYSYFLPVGDKFIVQAVVLTLAVGSFANSWLMDFTPGHLLVYFLVLAFATLPRSLSPRPFLWERG